MSRKYLIFPEKFPRFPDSRQNLPDSRNKFVFLPKQPLLELSPPVFFAAHLHALVNWPYDKLILHGLNSYFKLKHYFNCLRVKDLFDYKILYSFWYLTRNFFDLVQVPALGEMTLKAIIAGKEMKILTSKAIKMLSSCMGYLRDKYHSTTMRPWLI